MPVGRGRVINVLVQVHDAGRAMEHVCGRTTGLGDRTGLGGALRGGAGLTNAIVHWFCGHPNLQGEL